MVEDEDLSVDCKEFMPNQQVHLWDSNGKNAQSFVLKAVDEYLYYDPAKPSYYLETERGGVVLHMRNEATHSDVECELR